MSVIAKMYVQKSGAVPAGALISMSCVYDADLATASNEDVRFTKASPWGEATFELRNQLQESSSWYLLFDKDLPDFAGCDYALKVRCHVVHDYGTSKQVEVSTAYDQNDIPSHKLTSLRDKGSPPLHLKMTIDNPGASVQFVPDEVYYLTIYYAGRFKSMDEVVLLARG